MVRLIVHILLLVVLAVFIGYNIPYRTTVNLFGMKVEEVSVIVVILLSIVAGVVYSFLTYFLHYLARLRRGRQKERAFQTKQKERELRERERDIDQIQRQRDTAARPGEPGAGPADIPVPPDEEKGRKPRSTPRGR